MAAVWSNRKRAKTFSGNRRRSLSPHQVLNLWHLSHLRLCQPDLVADGLNQNILRAVPLVEGQWCLGNAYLVSNICDLIFLNRTGRNPTQLLFALWFLLVPSLINQKWAWLISSAGPRYTSYCRWGDWVWAKEKWAKDESEEVCKSVRKSSHLKCRFNYSVDTRSGYQKEWRVDEGQCCICLMRATLILPSFVWPFCVGSEIMWRNEDEVNSQTITCTCNRNIETIVIHVCMIGQKRLHRTMATTSQIL